MNRIQAQHVVISSHSLGRNPRLAFSDTVENLPEERIDDLLRGHNAAARIYPISDNITTADSHAGTFSAACAVTVWRGGALPERYDGQVFSCDPTGNLIHCDELVPRGATFRARRSRERSEFLASPDNWFRPVFLATGPDGALYVVDFHTPLAENTSQPKRYKGRDHAHGRIWRITYKGLPLLEPPRIVGQPVRDVLDVLHEAYENTTRHLARRELQERDPQQVIPHLKKWVEELKPSDSSYELCLLEALWIYQGLEVVEPQLLKRVLKTTKDYRIRASATRLLRFWQDSIEGSIELLSELVEDENIRVRLQAVLALGFSSSGEARNIALRATKHPMDRGLTKVLEDTIDYFERVGSQD